MTLTTPLCAGRILLADDDLVARSAQAIWLTSAGYEVLQARDGEEALALLGSSLVGEIEPIDLIVSDDCMPGPTGLEVLGGIRDACPTVPVILLTSFVDPHLRAEAGRLGISALLERPIHADALRDAVARSVPPFAAREVPLEEPTRAEAPAALALPGAP